MTNPNFCMLNKLLIKLSKINSITISIVQMRKQDSESQKDMPSVS